MLGMGVGELGSRSPISNVGQFFNEPQENLLVR